MDGRGDTEDPGPCVCDACIGEPLLSREIAAGGDVADCSYCDRTRVACFDIPRLAERVDPVWRAFVGTAEEAPHVSEDSVWWVPEGDYPATLMAELIVAADESIADDLIAHLSDTHDWDVFGGDFDAYDAASNIYAMREPQDPRYHDAWAAFCTSIKHGRRFFSDDLTELLDDILGPLLAGTSSQFSTAIRTIGPEDEDRFIYRARPANDEGQRFSIYASPLRQMGAPPPARATAGRMNAPGIPVFYGAFDVETCVAEIRGVVGGTAIAASFEIIRPLRFLDLTRLQQLQNTLSPFHPDYVRDNSYAQFAAGFHSAIKQPFVPGNEALDYLPTQAVAEYLWTRDERGVDGIIFGSSQVSGDHQNIVLFPGAFVVEGADVEATASVRHAFISIGNPDDPEPPTEYVSQHEHAVQPAAAIDPFGEVDLSDLGEGPLPVVRSTPTASLRWVGGLIRAEVAGIRYQVTEIPVVQTRSDRAAEF